MTKEELEKAKKRVLKIFNNHVKDFIRYMQEAEVVDKRRISPFTYLLWDQIRQEQIELEQLEKTIKDYQKKIDKGIDVELFKKRLDGLKAFRFFLQRSKALAWVSLNEEYEVLSVKQNAVYEEIYDDIIHEW